MSSQKEIVEEFSQWVDDQIDFNKLVGGFAGSVIERLDGALFGFAINYGVEKVPEEHRVDVLTLMEAVTTGHIDSIADVTIKNIVTHVKTGFGDEKEAIVLSGLWDIIHQLIQKK